MHEHLSDEQLILRFYDESSRAERAEVDEALAACDECRARWRALVGTFDLLDAATVPEPAPGFEARMWADVRRHLPAPKATPSFGARFGSWAVIGSWAALVALIAGVTVGHRRSVTTVTPAASSLLVPVSTVTPARPRADERVLVTALVEHFAETEMLLVELMNSPAKSDEDFAFERAMADGLVASGRLYRETAQQTGNPQLADTLDELDGVLVEVARSPNAVDARELASLRARIADDDLLFKVRAVSNDVRIRQRTLTLESE